MDDFTYNELMSESKVIRALRKELSRVQVSIHSFVLPEHQVLFYDICSTVLSYVDRIETERHLCLSLLTETHDAILVLNESFEIVYWNTRAEVFYGYESVKIQNLSILSILNSAESFSLLKEALLSYHAWSGEQIHLTASKSRVSVHTKWKCVSRFHTGDARYFVSISDLTEQKELQAKLIKSQRLEGLGLLATGIAHDLNNILTPIMMGIKTIRSQVDDPNVTHILFLIEASSKRGEGMVKQILTYASGASHTSGLVDMYALVAELESLITSSLPLSVVFEKEMVEECWALVGESTELFQVVLNLCINARDAIEGRGSIQLAVTNFVLESVLETHVSIVPPGDYVRISVTDTGLGINDEDLNYIFDPFYTTKSNSEGTGLGLSTVSSIVTKYKGGMDVNSKLGEWTEFVVYLPAQRHKLD